MDQKRIRKLEQKISTDYGNTTGVAVLKEGKLAVSYTHLTLPTNREV